MKEKQHTQAINLRKNGLSINKIAQRLVVSKSSVSVWVRDTKLNKHQMRVLSQSVHTQGVIEKRRHTRLLHEETKRNIIRQHAFRQIKSVSRRDLFHIGVALYWAEGSKTKRGSVEFSNSDPKLVMIMKRFFEEICDVRAEKFRGHVYLHPHLSSIRAERFWSKVSGIPRRQFHKTTQQHNRASLGKKDSLPYGTFTTAIYDTNLFLNIQGWMNGFDHILNKISN